MRNRAILAAILFSLCLCGCSMSNWSRATDESVLHVTPAGTTRPAMSPGAIELVRVEPDGSAILRISAQTVTVKPGQVLRNEEAKGSKSKLMVVATDPTKQQITLRGEEWRLTKPAFWPAW